jgi:hypothetical protein
MWPSGTKVVGGFPKKMKAPWVFRVVSTSESVGILLFYLNLCVHYYLWVYKTSKVTMLRGGISSSHQQSRRKLCPSTYTSHVATIIPASCLHPTWRLARLYVVLAVPCVWIQLDDSKHMISHWFPAYPRQWRPGPRICRALLVSIWFLIGFLFSLGRALPLSNQILALAVLFVMNSARCQRAYIWIFISFLFSFAKDLPVWNQLDTDEHIISHWFPILVDKGPPCEFNSMSYDFSLIFVVIDEGLVKAYITVWGHMIRQ